MTTPDPAELQRPYAEWFAGLESGDVARSIAATAEDVVLRSPLGDVQHGRDEVAAALARFHADYTETVRWELTVEQVEGDTATVRVREVTTATPRDGGPSLLVSGWHLGTLRREADGAWRIVEDAATFDGPPEPLPG